MDEQDQAAGEVAEPGDDVEAHGVKEVVTTGLSAAALLAASGTASAATGQSQTPAAARPAAQAAFLKVGADPTVKMSPTDKRGVRGSREVQKKAEAGKVVDKASPL